MLCCDGCSGALDDAAIADLLGTGPSTPPRSRLVQAALDNGTTDNVTVIVAEVVPSDAEARDRRRRDRPDAVGAAAAQPRRGGMLGRALFRRQSDTGELEAVDRSEPLDPEELRYAPATATAGTAACGALSSSWSRCAARRRACRRLHLDPGPVLRRRRRRVRRDLPGRPARPARSSTCPRSTRPTPSSWPTSRSSTRSRSATGSRRAATPMPADRPEPPGPATRRSCDARRGPPSRGRPEASTSSRRRKKASRTDRTPRTTRPTRSSPRPGRCRRHRHHDRVPDRQLREDRP